MRTFDRIEDLHAAMAETMKDVLQRGGETPRAMMISGGSTPLPVYAHLAKHPFAAAGNACIAFADDRHVPAVDPQSNYGAALPMIEALGIPGDQVLRVDASMPLVASARAYHEQLDAFLEAGGVLDTAFLGLGADGHTCSLFGDDDLRRGAGRWAVEVPKDTPPHRVSVTPELLARIGRIVFVVAGDDKHAIVDQFTRDPLSTTAGKALAGRDCELWYG